MQEDFLVHDLFINILINLFLIFLRAKGVQNFEMTCAKSFGAVHLFTCSLG